MYSIEYKHAPAVEIPVTNFRDIDVNAMDFQISTRDHARTS